MKTPGYLLLGLLAVCATESFDIDNGNYGALATSDLLTRIFFNPATGFVRDSKANTEHRQPKTTTEKPITPTKNTIQGWPPWFVKFRSASFYQNLAATTWDSARETCKNIDPDGDLAVINSKEELDFIKENFGGGKEDLRWIGLHKDGPGAPFKWTNGETVEYFPWALKSKAEEPKGYVALNLTSFRFIPQTNPNKTLPFLCELRAGGSDRRAAFVGHNQLFRGQGFRLLNAANKKGGDTISRKIPGKVVNKCKSGWQRFMAKCYKDFNAISSFNDAVATCKDAGASLMSLHSPKESQFVKELVMNRNRPSDMYWLGLSDDENGLAWSDGSPIDYSNWRPRNSLRPFNRTMGTGDYKKIHLKRCVQVDSEDLGWDFEDCDRLGYIICIQGGQTDFLPPMNTPETTRSESAKPTSAPAPLNCDMTNYPYNLVLGEAEFREVIKRCGYSNAVAAALDTSGISKMVNDSGSSPRALKISSEDSDSDDDDDDDDGFKDEFFRMIYIMMCSAGFVALVFGVIIWRHRVRNSAWKSLQNSPATENHDLQSVRHFIRGPETSVLHEQGIYGAIK
ncbi:hypothetical protein EGW08_015058 [Elysia chlorotica]|uniref:C-type lectin domain-containing protein n=1 Tax=Elysia chlorotica TaxID=188477 RepID=A0A3S1BC45_ELYCH|nr:hypothetical protein EGW08_015058 [Elysia chlorotica]